MFSDDRNEYKHALTFLRHAWNDEGDAIWLCRILRRVMETYTGVPLDPLEIPSEWHYVTSERTTI